ncbi:hypothetical protein B4N89_09535 [Embleya scabrispora]|uniref:Uncharacterized protein n=1 Tax=Embleya scabrispora TaxID=159449 RepID=A0A1T3NWY3_9ACTN|nr:hypothetical protein [Embleya scabrispora]OPC81160.1 hypothetical protein B4N89_09535 [Embleya scabrispora]
MSKTAIIALLAELNDVDGTIFARMREEMPAALRETETLPPALVRDALRRADQAALFAIAGNLGLPRGALAALYTGPALPALRALRALAPKNPRAYTEATRGLGELMERHLGDSTAAWGRLLAALPTRTTSLGAAIEAAGAGEEAADLRVPADLRAEFRQLLLLAPAGVLAELLPALRPHTVRDLLRFGAEVPPAVLAEQIARATPAQRLALARARRARPEVAGALIELGDSALNAAVYLNPRTGPAIRARIMASTTPLHPTVAERVCRDWAITIRLPALWSGDPLLVRSALLRRGALGLPLSECLAIWQERGVEGLRPYTHHVVPMPTGRQAQPFRAPRYRLVLLITLLRLGERSGPRAALDLVADLALPEPLAARCRELLTGPDALDRLRTEVAAAGGTRRLARRLRGHLPGVGWPMIETPVVDWAEIRRAHRRNPFGVRALALLLDQDGCPSELRRAAEAVPRSPYRPRPGRWPTPVTWSDPRGMHRRPPEEQTTATELATGRMPLAEVLTRPRAAAAAELLGRCEAIAPDAPAARELRERFRALIEHQVAPEDRVPFAVVALRLLPDFEGSLAELVTTAAGAART